MSYNEVVIRGSIIKTTSIKSHPKKTKMRHNPPHTLIAYSEVKYTVSGRKVFHVRVNESSYRTKGG